MEIGHVPDARAQRLAGRKTASPSRGSGLTASDPTDPIFGQVYTDPLRPTAPGRDGGGFHVKRQASAARLPASGGFALRMCGHRRYVGGRTGEARPTNS